MTSQRKREACRLNGAKGGRATLQRHGVEHFQRIGRLGTWQSQVAKGWELERQREGLVRGLKRGAGERLPAPSARAGKDTPWSTD